MAFYAELFELRNNSELKNKVTIAVIVAAEAIRASPPPVDPPKSAWAKAAFESPRREADRMLMALLAVNKDLDVDAIQALADTAIQTQVDAAVDVFAGS